MSDHRLAGKTPPPFWATHAARAAEYESRIANEDR